MKRKAYDIKLVCRLNGCQWSARLFLRDQADAFEAIYRMARYSMRDHEKKLSKDWFRVSHCELSSDQTRHNV